METGGRRKSSWVLLALALVVVIGWLAINLIGGARAAG